MELTTKQVSIILGTSASVTMPEPAVSVTAAGLIVGGATAFAATAQTIVATTPTGAQVQFTGTANAPSTALTLGAAPTTAGGLLIVTFVPVHAVPASI